MDEQSVVLQCLESHEQLFSEYRICGQKLPRRRGAGASGTNEKRSTARSLHANLPAAVSKGDGYDRDNLLKADKLLNEAGWVLKGQQRVNVTTGQPLSFELLLPASSNSQWVLPFQHSLQRLGINMDIRKVDNSQITNRMRSRDYDMMPRVWRAMPWPSSDLQISWSSEYINSTYNAPGVQSPVIDSLINQIIAAQGNKEKLLPLGRALDRVLTWNYYMLPMWYMAEDRLAWWINSPNPLYALFTAWVSIPGGMTLTKRRNCRQPDNRESRWALI